MNKIDLINGSAGYLVINDLIDQDNKKSIILTPFNTCFGTTYKYYTSKKIDNIFFLKSEYNDKENKYKYDLKYLRKLLDQLIIEHKNKNIYISLLDYFGTNNEELDKIIKTVYNYKKKHKNLFIIVDFVVAGDNYLNLKNKDLIDFSITGNRKFIKSEIHGALLYKEGHINKLIINNRFRIIKKLEHIKRKKGAYQKAISENTRDDILTDSFINDLEKKYKINKEDFFFLDSLENFLYTIVKENFKIFEFLNDYSKQEILTGKVKLTKRELDYITKNHKTYKNNFSSKYSKVYNHFLYYLRYFKAYTFKDMEIIFSFLIGNNLLKVYNLNELMETFNLIEKTYLFTKNINLKEHTTFNLSDLEKINKDIKKLDIQLKIPKNITELTSYFIQVTMSDKVKVTNKDIKNFKTKLIDKKLFTELSGKKTKYLLTNLNGGKYLKSVMWRANYDDIILFINQYEKYNQKELSILEKNKIILSGINNVNGYLIIYK